MFRTTMIVIASCVVAGSGGAQTVISSAYPAVVGFGFLPTNGGTSLGPLGNDSEHDIVTTVGNPLFPAGNVRIANDGVVIVGITSGDVAPANGPIPAVGFPAGLPPGAAAILPLWDDLNPLPGFQNTSLWWKEDAGVLTIEWKNEYTCCTFPQAATVTFEVQVFANPALGAPWIQILYFDTVFSNPLPPTNPFTSPCDNGACATIGYVAGPSFGNNVTWSVDTQSIAHGTVLSIFRR